MGYCLAAGEKHSQVAIQVVTRSAIRKYNTRLGAGTPEHFIRAWDRLVAPVLD
jgi:hypothetical protein